MLRAALCAAALAASVVSLSPAQAERVTVSQYGILVPTLPYAVALEKGFFKEEGLDIDGIIGSHGGGTSVRNMLASDLPVAEMALPAAIARRISTTEPAEITAHARDTPARSGERRVLKTVIGLLRSCGVCRGSAARPVAGSPNSCSSNVDANSGDAVRALSCR